jgi:hypothetical protein
MDSYVANQGKRYEDIEPRLESAWGEARGESNLDWNKAKNATRDAYERLYNRAQTRNE